MRIVVLGLGSIGRRHATNLLRQGLPVVGFDINSAACKAFANCGGELVTEREAALALASNGGAVIIATPNVQHRADVVDALSGGSHVFVEKPFAHRLDGLAEAVEAAEKRGQIVFAAHNLRYHPAVEGARELIDAGALGEIFWARAICASYLPDWRPKQDYRTGYAADPETGGVIFDVTHEFDLCAHLLGPYRTTWAAVRRSGHLRLASEDTADIRLEHESGAVTMLHFDYLTRPPVRVMDIAGSEGRIAIDIVGRRMTLWSSDGTVLSDVAAESLHADDYTVEIKHFLECIGGGEFPRCNGGEALSVLREVVAARAMAGLPMGDENKA